MGVDLNCAQLLLRAKKNGASFERMATLGRQGLHANRPALISILRNAGYQLSADIERKLLDAATVYAEEFFRLLGAKQITAIDASDYEGAQVVHDMNRPIPDSLADSFDLVLDGETLEHVFNFPTGIQNAMQMVAPNACSSPLPWRITIPDTVSISSRRSYSIDCYVKRMATR